MTTTLAALNRSAIASEQRARHNARVERNQAHIALTNCRRTVYVCEDASLTLGAAFMSNHPISATKHFEQ